MEIVPQLVEQLIQIPWGHHRTLIDKLGLPMGITAFETELKAAGNVKSIDLTRKFAYLPQGRR